MSMFFSGKSSSCDYVSPTQDTKPEPNPYRFKILELYEFNNTVLLKIEYPDATSFDGIKILVYDICYKDYLLSSKYIDPHFLDDEISPLARFKGNDIGMTLASKFCTAIEFKGDKCLNQ